MFMAGELTGAGLAAILGRVLSAGVKGEAVAGQAVKGGVNAEKTALDRIGNNPKGAGLTGKAPEYGA